MRFLTLLGLLLSITLFQKETFLEDPYEYQDHGNRNEGRRAIGIGAPDLELLSFVGYKEEIEPESSVVLKIKFYLQRDSFFYITAKELKVRHFYLMKPNMNQWQKGWQEFAPWPTKDVLRPIRLSIDHLGIVGRLHHDRIGSGEIAPLIIYHSRLPSKLQSYILYLTSKEDLRKLDYKLFKEDENEPVIQHQIRNLFGGVPFSINLDLSSFTVGYYKLQLDGRYKNKFGGPHRSYTFYHNPRVRP